MFRVSGWRCNKEQNPVCLLPSDLQATTSRPCPSRTPPGAALLPLGHAGRGDQWHFLLGEQMVQRMGTGVTWQGTGGTLLVWEGGTGKVRDVHDVIFEPLPLSSSYFKKGKLCGTKEPKDESNPFSWKHFPIHKVMNTSQICLCD